MSASILAIVPTEGLRNRMWEIASHMEALDLQIVIANQSGSVKIAAKIGAEYDAIIACSGTAELLRDTCSIPVIAMGISRYDLLCCFMLAQFGTKKAAIVGLSFITSKAAAVKALFQYQIDIITIHDDQETSACLTRLREEHYTLVIGDTLACTIADSLGMESNMIVFGDETIENVLSRTVELVDACRRQKQRADLCEQLLQDADQVTLAFNTSKHLVLSAGSAPSKLAIVSEWDNKPALWENAKNEPTLERFGDGLWLTRKKNVRLSAENYVCFHLRPFPSIPVGAKRGISIMTDMESEHIATESYMEHSKIMSPVLELARRYSKFNFPVVLIGERGVGKDTLAYIMNAYSKQKFAATVMIDCILIDEEEWMRLLNDTGSILFQFNVMFYYRNFEMLSPLLKEKIVKHIKQMKTKDRSFHIVAVNSDSTASEVSCLFPSSLNTLQCNTLFIPSLRARHADIPDLVALYTNQLNNHLGTRPVRIEPAALALLQNFSWPGNLYQLKRIIIELISMKAAPIISEEDVRLALRHETSNMVISNTSMRINMSGTLEDIEKRIICFVLDEENMSYTRTAARLGISRATLWRKMKEIPV